MNGYTDLLPTSLVPSHILPYIMENKSHIKSCSKPPTSLVPICSNLCAQVAPWFSTFCISATRSEVMIFTDRRRSGRATSSKAKGNGWSLLGLGWSRDLTEKKHGMEKVLDM